MPTGNAAARQAFEISSAGVVMKRSSAAYSSAGHATIARNASEAHTLIASNNTRFSEVELGQHRGHAHMFAATQCNDRAQHRQPDEDHRGKFVRPHERPVEHEARDDAGQQHHDVCQHERARGEVDQRAEPTIEEHDGRRAVREARRLHAVAMVRHVGRGAGPAGPAAQAETGSCRMELGHLVHVSLPTERSRIAQASSPYLPFHSP